MGQSTWPVKRSERFEKRMEVVPNMSPYDRFTPKTKYL